MFAALALVNTAAMATAERRAELATIRLLGGTAGHVTRMVALELVPMRARRARRPAAAIAAAAIIGVPERRARHPVVVPASSPPGSRRGAARSASRAGGVTARIALRVTPAAAMRVQE